MQLSKFSFFCLCETKDARKRREACTRSYLKIVLSVKEVAEVMEKKTTRNWIVEQTNLFGSIVVDPAIKFILTLKRKALEKEVFGKNYSKL